MSKTTHIVNHGFLPDTITEEHHRLGGVTRIAGVPLRPDGQWDEYLPEKEIQHNAHFDTMNCSNYGTLNALETLANFHKYPSIIDNFSERYTGVQTGTTRAGNFPHEVAEVIRKECGLIPEKSLPFNAAVTSWEAYYSPNPMTPQYEVEGNVFLNNYRINHDWVFLPRDPMQQKLVALKDALQFSPVGVSVLAWKQDDKGLYYKNAGESDTHWCMVYGYVEGEYWKVFDSYDNTHKKLRWEYDFGYAKRYALSINDSPQSNWLTSFFKSVWGVIHAILSAPFKRGV